MARPSLESAVWIMQDLLGSPRLRDAYDLAIAVYLRTLQGYVIVQVLAST